MIPMKASSVFKSRWWALLWSAGIIWFAYDVAESAPKGESNEANAEQATDVTGAPITPQNEERLREALKKF